jgi:ribonucleoside-diphosphate reductase alpha chain
MFRELILSYGIEPPFFMYFWKRTRMSGKYQYYFNVPRIVRQMFELKGLKIPIDADSILDTWDGSKGKPIAAFIDEHKDKFNFIESTDVKPFDKLEMMSKMMKWIDSSISTTYMFPEKSTWKDVYDFILESYKKEIKSITAFPDRKMYGIVSKIPFRDLAFKLKEEGLGMYPSDFTDEEMKELNISKENIDSVTHAPERLTSLDADIYVISVKGEKFVIVVGLQNNQPYEIFGGHVNGFGFKFAQKKGKITKVKTRQYSLEIGDVVIEDFSKQFTPTEQILFRLTSMSMRYGVPISFIVEQLQKATQDITSMASAAARVLKKYVKDGTVITGQICPSCGSSKLVYMDGCMSCSKCSWSKCN